ncbi:G protein alpha q subunit-like [Galleria mellonella]|uniref:G protein alpha q subunit-like n=1 Tax=Galleria mellonella TaxID=7137 RepID=A0ABM3N265_GALME|nr:G protein alpha q subunit-like [Galleria mellonella]
MIVRASSRWSGVPRLKGLPKGQGSALEDSLRPSALRIMECRMSEEAKEQKRINQEIERQPERTKEMLERTQTAPARYWRVRQVNIYQADENHPRLGYSDDDKRGFISRLSEHLYGGGYDMIRAVDLPKYNTGIRPM